MRSSVLPAAAIFTSGVSSMRTSSPPVECPRSELAGLDPPCAITCRRSRSARRGIEAVGCVAQLTMRAFTPRRSSARPSVVSTSLK